MSRELKEVSARVENTTQKQLVDTIKTAKKEYDTSEQISITTIPNSIQKNTSEIIEKIDSKIPLYVQLYSELYKKYLHIASNFCNTSYVSQKEFYDKIGKNDARFAMFDAYLELVKKMILLQIDLNENMMKLYVGNRLTVLDFYDQMIGENVFNFTKMFFKFSNFNK